MSSDAMFEDNLYIENNFSMKPEAFYVSPCDMARWDDLNESPSWGDLNESSCVSKYDQHGPCDMCEILFSISENKYVEYLQKRNNDITNMGNSRYVLSMDKKISYSLFLEMLKINSNYGVNYDCEKLLTNIKFISITKDVASEIINTILQQIPNVNINRVLLCFIDLDILEYVFEILELNHDVVFSYCIENKFSSNNIYKYLSNKVSDLNLFKNDSFIVTCGNPVPFDSYDFLNDFIECGFDCSKISMSFMAMSVFGYIREENIKYFCEMKITKFVYYGIIFGDHDMNKIREFIKCCPSPTPTDSFGHIYESERTKSLLKMIDEFSISKDECIEFFNLGYH